MKPVETGIQALGQSLAAAGKQGRQVMKAKYLFALAALGSVATSANAAVFLTAVPGTPVYSGPTPTYDFDVAGVAPITGGDERPVTSDTGTGAPPVGATGSYWSVGPGNLTGASGPPTTTPGFLDLSSFVQIGSISFLWGSVDSYNLIEVMSKATPGLVIESFGGNEAAFPANGDQINPLTNPLVTLTVTGNHQFDIGGLRLSSTDNALEIDNVAIAAVPEPGTWLLMLLGFGLVGGAMRASKKRETGPRVRYAF